MTEMTVLALGVLLTGVYQLFHTANAAPQVGLGYALSARDQKRELTGRAGRISRALDNQVAALAIFAAAAIAVTLTASASGFTAGCAWVWLVARILYLPAYALGLSPWRSLIWGVGWAASMAMAAAAAF